jgi:Leucine-rich repeat (LRR) protein
VTGFSSLRILDVSNCELDEWSQILSLGTLASLEELILDGNPALTQVIPPADGSFERLVRFSISSSG